MNNQAEKNMTDEITFGIKKVDDPIAKSRYNVMVRNNVIAGLLAETVVERVVKASTEKTIKRDEVKLDPVVDLNDLMRKFYDMDGDTAVSLLFDDDASEDAVIDISFAKYSSYTIDKDALRSAVKNIWWTNDGFREAIRLNDNGRGVLGIGRFSAYDLKSIAKRAKKITGKRLNKIGIPVFSINIHYVSGTNLILDKDRAVVGSETYSAFTGSVELD